MSQSPIQLVIFDLGRVLVRICDDWQHACRIGGVSMPGNLPPLDAAALARTEEIISRYDTGVTDLQTFAAEISHHRGLRPQDIVRVQEVFLLGAYPGVAELIDDLHKAGLKTACLSNTSDIHWQMCLDPSNLNYVPLERMTWRFASYQLGLRKPHDEIYQHVERETKTSPESIIFFDDLEPNIATARRRGWNAYQIAIDDNPIDQARHQLCRHGVL